MPWVKSNLVCIALAIALQTQSARAQGDLLGTDEMAEAIISMTSPVWTGPRAEPPPATARPGGNADRLSSNVAPLVVHADPDMSAAAAERALGALEAAQARLAVAAWPAPIPDGDRGGGPGFDLYITSALPEGAYSDGLAPWSFLDRASTFAVLSPAALGIALEACVTEAYAEALLLGVDPAEASAWRKATAAWLAWELTGTFGCEYGIHEQQAETQRSWISGAAQDGSGGALLLAYLSARHGAGPGGFVRDAWTLAMQRTWEGDALRAEPDLWSAIDVAIELSGDRLLDNVEDLAVSRWFVGGPVEQRGALAAVDSDARVPVTREMKRLPSRIVANQPLAPFGSAYALIDAGPGSRRWRAWLQGEYGVRWSFVAVQLDARGAELARIAAPHTLTTPKAYLPLELRVDARHVLFVVTNLGHGLPDADEAEVHQRGFQLTVDRAPD